MHGFRLYFIMGMPRQLTLALDASQASGSIALFEGDRLSYASYFNVSITHSETLMPQLDAALKLTGFTPAEISRILLANGPGSFTGLRIGLATAKGIAYANRCPLRAFSSLKLAALPRMHCGKNILSVIDARMKEVYAALWDEDLNLIQGPEVCPPQEILNWDFGEAWLIGDGSHILPADDRLTALHPTSLGYVPAIGLYTLDLLSESDSVYDFDSLADLQPFYLRDFSAQIQRNN
ncbi:MAG TPA: tRNA (adenosine(37)-N6)-threonylcarbamoyltransferase complex dimerization subunit type 1 TsaB [Candidatus Cloacimonas sp.]|jgi:tRNA threonylcarbamoyladenosine biosynthesis protein TsaB|nr:tRNA (adenosine(37)-N6)-threonylcarbamoyltransferase complex dimerization subunit type 1 TsaB [Candidatus Cloacimonas sp.]